MKTYTADAELSELVKEAAASGYPLEIVVDGERFAALIVRSSNSQERKPLTNEAAARSLAGIRRAAGSWRDLVDAEELKADIRERRRASSRPDLEL
jgi:hypothetical protein